MIRIAEMCFDTDVELIGESISATIPRKYDLTNEQIEALKNAKIIERLDMNYGQEVGVLGTYNLVDWQKIEKTINGMRFTWQTYSITDINQLRQDNEDLTQAVLELAEIIGGSENG